MENRPMTPANILEWLISSVLAAIAIRLAISLIPSKRKVELIDYGRDDGQADVQPDIDFRVGKPNISFTQIRDNYPEPIPTFGKRRRKNTRI
jgi:hypothetical protein